MKHSFIYKEQKLALIALSLALCTLSSCNKHKVSSDQQDTTCVESSTSDTTGVEGTEAVGQNSQQSPEKSTTNSVTSSSPSTEASSSLANKAYEFGYDDGLHRFDIGLDHFTKNNEARLKSTYMLNCTRYKLGEENKTNKALYKEYRRGFIKGM